MTAEVQWYACASILIPENRIYWERTMTDLMAAQLAVMNLQARYVDAVWRKDHDTIVDCFAADGEWRIAGTVVKGHADLMKFSKRSQEGSRALLVTLRNPAVHIDNGQICSRTYFTAHNFLEDGTIFTPIGMYYERFAEERGGLRFKWRLFQTLYSGGPDYKGRLLEFPDYGPPPSMPPLDAVPSVKGAHWHKE
jgi:hypothetical protein